MNSKFEVVKFYYVSFFLQRAWVMRPKCASAQSAMNHFFHAHNHCGGCAHLCQTGLLEGLPSRAGESLTVGMVTWICGERETDRGDTGWTSQKVGFPRTPAGVKNGTAVVLGTGQLLGLLKGSAIAGFLKKNLKARAFLFELLKCFRNHNTQLRITWTIDFPNHYFYFAFKIRCLLIEKVNFKDTK